MAAHVWPNSHRLRPQLNLILLFLIFCNVLTLESCVGTHLVPCRHREGKEESVFRTGRVIYSISGRTGGWNADSLSICRDFIKCYSENTWTLAVESRQQSTPIPFSAAVSMCNPLSFHVRCTSTFSRKYIWQLTSENCSFTAAAAEPALLRISWITNAGVTVWIVTAGKQLPITGLCWQEHGFAFHPPLTGQYTCVAGALEIRSESEGAEKYLQHQLFTPKQILSSAHNSHCASETRGHMAAFISDGLHWFSPADKPISTVLETDEDVTLLLLSFFIHPTLEPDL